MKHFRVLNFDLFTACFAFALLNDHDAPLAHLCPAAQGYELRARFRGTASSALRSCCPRDSPLDGTNMELHWP